MQFLRDAGSFAEPFFEAHVELACKLPQTQAIKNQDCKRAGRDNAKPEPPGLPECGRHFKIECGFTSIPEAGCVAGRHMEAIRTWTEVGINGLAPFQRAYPAAIVAIQLESIANALGDGKVQTREIKANSLMAGWNA